MGKSGDERRNRGGKAGERIAMCMPLCLLIPLCPPPPFRWSVVHLV